MIYLLITLTSLVVVGSVVVFDRWAARAIQRAVDAAFADITEEDFKQDGDEALFDVSLRVHADAALDALAEAEATVKAELARLEH